MFTGLSNWIKAPPKSCFEAARAGDLEKLRVELGTFYDPNIPLVTKEGNILLLQIAASRGYLAIIDFLVEKGAHINKVDEAYADSSKVSSPPLHMAASCGQVGAIECLIGHGAHVNEATDNGYPLHYVATANNADAIVVLVRHGAAIDAPMKCGRTPLHIATQCGQSDAIETLIQLGANLYALDNEGNGLLHYANVTNYGYPQRPSVHPIKMLVEDYGMDVHSKNNRGEKPATTAAYNKFVLYKKEVIERLKTYEQQYPPGRRTPKTKSNNTVLSTGPSDSHGFIMNSRPTKIQVQEVLFGVAKSGYGIHFIHRLVEVISRAMGNGAEINAVNKNGDTALMIAAENNNLLGVEFLARAYSANLDIENKQGYTALSLAAKKGHARIISSLVYRFNANVNAKSKLLITPLIAATREGHLAAVKLLLSLGANINVSGPDKQTALTIAKQKAENALHELKQARYTAREMGGGRVILLSNEYSLLNELANYLECINAGSEKRPTRKSASGIPSSPISGIRNLFGTDFFSLRPLRGSYFPDCYLLLESCITSLNAPSSSTSSTLPKQTATRRRLPAELPTSPPLDTLPSPFSTSQHTVAASSTLSTPIKSLSVSPTQLSTSSKAQLSIIPLTASSFSSNTLTDEVSNTSLSLISPPTTSIDEFPVHLQETLADLEANSSPSSSPAPLRLQTPPTAATVPVTSTPKPHKPVTPTSSAQANSDDWDNFTGDSVNDTDLSEVPVNFASVAEPSASTSNPSISSSNAGPSSSSSLIVIPTSSSSAPEVLSGFTPTEVSLIKKAIDNGGFASQSELDQIRDTLKSYTTGLTPDEMARIREALAGGGLASQVDLARLETYYSKRQSWYRALQGDENAALRSFSVRFEQALGQIMAACFLISSGYIKLGKETTQQKVARLVKTGLESLGFIGMLAKAGKATIDAFKFIHELQPFANFINDVVSSSAVERLPEYAILPQGLKTGLGKVTRLLTGDGLKRAERIGNLASLYDIEAMVFRITQLVTTMHGAQIRSLSAVNAIPRFADITVGVIVYAIKEGAEGKGIITNLHADEQVLLALAMGNRAGDTKLRLTQTNPVSGKAITVTSKELLQHSGIEIEATNQLLPGETAQPGGERWRRANVTMTDTKRTLLGYRSMSLAHATYIREQTALRGRQTWEVVPMLALNNQPAPAPITTSSLSLPNVSSLFATTPKPEPLAPTSAAELDKMARRTEKLRQQQAEHQRIEELERRVQEQAQATRLAEELARSQQVQAIRLSEELARSQQAQQAQAAKFTEELARSRQEQQAHQEKQQVQEQQLREQMEQNAGLRHSLITLQQKQQQHSDIIRQIVPSDDPSGIVSYDADGQIQSIATAQQGSSSDATTGPRAIHYLLSQIPEHHERFDAITQTLVDMQAENQQLAREIRRLQGSTTESKAETSTPPLPIRARSQVALYGQPSSEPTPNPAHGQPSSEPAPNPAHGQGQPTLFGSPNSPTLFESTDSDDSGSESDKLFDPNYKPPENPSFS